MSQEIARGFQLGDRAFLVDGSSGLVTASRFDEAAEFWEHLLGGIPRFFPEAELFHEDPTVAPVDDDELNGRPEGFFGPPGERGEFVTHDEMIDFVVEFIGVQPDVEVDRADLADLRLEVLNAANLTAQANLAVHISAVEVMAAELELSREARFSELESAVTTGLSEIEKRSTDLEAVAEESSGTGFFSFIGGLGGLLLNPVDWIMSRLGDHIRDEVNDGLNR